MEYVKDAIEKARREREARGDEPPAAPSADRAQPEQPRKPAPVLPAGEAVQVEYTKTRSEQLNRRVLMDNRIVAAFETDARAEPYRQLRTQVLKKMRDNGWRTLALTSAHPDAGKTLTAVNLAIALARELNQTVLLVDLDFKGPNILDMLGIQAEAGLVEHLQGKVELEDILVNPGLERLTILPALPVAGVTSELLSSPVMKATLDEIVGRYEDRFLIFDLPPLLRDDDALVFTPYVDATLLVVENGVTTPADMERCVQLLEGTHVLGTVFNKAD